MLQNEKKNETIFVWIVYKQTDTHFMCTNPIRRFYLCLFNVSILTPFPFENPVMILSSACLSAALSFSILCLLQNHSNRVCLWLWREEMKKTHTNILISFHLESFIWRCLFILTFRTHALAHQISMQTSLSVLWFKFFLSLSLSLYFFEDLYLQDT